MGTTSSEDGAEPGSDSNAAGAVDGEAVDRPGHPPGQMPTLPASRSSTAGLGTAGLGSAEADAEPGDGRAEVAERERAVESQFPGSTEVSQLGRYVLLGTLGKGGMGTVFEAFDRTLDRRVAIKVLRHTADEHGLRLMREAQAMAKLSHPNVVQVYEVGRAQGRAFVAMELVQALADTKAIIFDMRGYPKGTAWSIAPYLDVHPGPTAAARFVRPRISGRDGLDGGKGVAFVQRLPEVDVPHYAGPTVMLIDERTQSQAEHTGLFFEAANGTRFVGSPTSGTNGDVTSRELPDGTAVGFTGQAVTSARGRPLQRVGLPPHLLVEPTLAGIRSGRDEVLEEAIDWLVADRLVEAAEPTRGVETRE
ncbi:MAG: S41 family peptidase [Myxococcota bacterium]